MHFLYVALSICADQSVNTGIIIKCHREILNAGSLYITAKVQRQYNYVDGKQTPLFLRMCAERHVKDRKVVKYTHTFLFK